MIKKLHQERESNSDIYPQLETKAIEFVGTMFQDKLKLQEKLNINSPDPASSLTFDHYITSTFAKLHEIYGSDFLNKVLPVLNESASGFDIFLNGEKAKLLPLIKNDELAQKDHLPYRLACFVFRYDPASRAS